MNNLATNRKSWADICETNPFWLFANGIHRKVFGRFGSPVVYPEFPKMFKALQKCNADNLKVVILAQDPYHNGSATGLAFDNYKTEKPSPSLRNILTELRNDIGEFKGNENKESYLEHLPAQGVLLLNVALSVKQGEPGSDIEFWRPFTETIIKGINTQDNIVWMLWGGYAKKYKEFITNPTHHVLEGAHPSPFSVKNFYGGKYFSKANTKLEEWGKTPILW